MSQQLLDELPWHFVQTFDIHGPQSFVFPVCLSNALVYDQIPSKCRSGTGTGADTGTGAGNWCNIDKLETDWGKRAGINTDRVIGEWETGEQVDVGVRWLGQVYIFDTQHCIWYHEISQWPFCLHYPHINKLILLLILILILILIKVILPHTSLYTFKLMWLTIIIHYYLHPQANYCVYVTMII